MDSKSLNLIHAFANETSVNTLLAAGLDEWKGPQLLAKSGWSNSHRVDMKRPSSVVLHPTSRY